MNNQEAIAWAGQNTTSAAIPQASESETVAISPETSGLELMTETRAQTARRCPREENLRYEMGIVPLAAITEPLRFGTLGHHGLEAWWNNLRDDRALEAALYAIAKMAIDDTDAFERARLEVLIEGYDARWGGEEYKPIAAELEFRAPLVNPETGGKSRTFQRAGKLDVLVRDASGRVFIVEHKFSGEDISHGSSFWARLRMGGQSAGYIRGAEALGYKVDGVIYDVIGKPKLRPYKATPEADRKYKRDGTLYANQRATDETVEEYRARVREEVAANPDKYYQRGTVVRLEEQMREHDLELWALSQSILFRRRAGIAPRNPDACQRYGSTCSYFAICAGEASIDDQTQFRRLEWFHPELTPSKEET